jgi:hypothetical protein
MPDWLPELQSLMKEHEFKQVRARDLSCIKFENEGVSVETCDGRAFGATQQREDGGTLSNSIVGISKLRDYLQWVAIELHN